MSISVQCDTQIRNCNIVWNSYKKVSFHNLDLWKCQWQKFLLEFFSDFRREIQVFEFKTVEIQIRQKMLMLWDIYGDFETLWSGTEEWYKQMHFSNLFNV